MNQHNTTKHHLLFPAAEWLIRPEAAALRQTNSLIPRLLRADHDYLHAQVPIVPLLGHRTMLAVNMLWTPENNTMRDIDGLCQAIGQAAMHPKSHEIETSLAELTIEAIQAQKAVLKEVMFV